MEESSFHKKSFDKKSFDESSFTELAKLEKSSLSTELPAWHLALSELEARALEKAAFSSEETSFQSKLPLGGPEQETALAQGGVLRGSLPAYSFTDLGHHYMVAQACLALLERVLLLSPKLSKNCFSGDTLEASGELKPEYFPQQRIAIVNMFFGPSPMRSPSGG